MKNLFLIPFILLSVLIISCDTCNNCGPLMNDPFVTIEFYNSENNQTVTIKMDSINNNSVNELGTSFTNRAFRYKLPLSPVSDTSTFELVFTEYSPNIPDTVQFKKDLQVAYNRQEIEINGTIKIRADHFTVVEHEYDSITPNFIDQNLSSNEIILKVYL